MWKPAFLVGALFLVGAFAAQAHAQFPFPWFGQPAPQGSYRQTCRNVSFDGSVLRAECRTERGDWRPSSIDTRQCRDRDIANQNGRLVCGRGGGGGGAVPGGSYRETCRNAYMSGPNLYADCRNERGDWRPSSIDTRQCRDRDITNQNGRLVCGGGWSGGGGAAPVGSYRQSCRNAAMSGATLYAQCQSASGAWRPSSIDTRQCSGRDIANQDGRLVCGGGWGGGGGGGGGSLPGGSYRQSCRNGVMSGPTLYAQCQSTSGAWRPASIDTRQCRGRDIANRDGRLVC